MKASDGLQDTIFDSGALMKDVGLALINNAGKLIALITALIMAAVTFADITFAGLSFKEALPSLLLLTVSSSVIYFSLEDAGEKLGEGTEEFKSAKTRYDRLRNEISGDDIEPLRAYSGKYSERELEFRKKSALLSAGLSERELNAYLSGSEAPGRTRRILRKIAKMKPVFITPKVLLSRERACRRSELENPETRKLLSLLLRLIPSAVCTLITVSVILTAKDGLTVTDVLNGVLKLSALPVAAFRGYSQGYTYAKHSLSLWLDTKSGILEGYLNGRNEEKEAA